MHLRSCVYFQPAILNVIPIPGRFLTTHHLTNFFNQTFDAPFTASVIRPNRLRFRHYPAMMHAHAPGPTASDYGTAVDYSLLNFKERGAFHVILQNAVAPNRNVYPIPAGSK